MNQGNKDKVEQSELDLYGIETVPAHVFLWGDYRYSNARDALAAAKRSGQSISHEMLQEADRNPARVPTIVC